MEEIVEHSKHNMNTEQCTLTVQCTVYVYCIGGMTQGREWYILYSVQCTVENGRIESALQKYVEGGPNQMNGREGKKGW